MDLNGRTALVTGGADGIGGGIAQRLAAEGMHVVIAGPAKWEQTLDLNLRAVMLATQLVLGPMAERGRVRNPGGGARGRVLRRHGRPVLAMGLAFRGSRRRPAPAGLRDVDPGADPPHRELAGPGSQS